MKFFIQQMEALGFLPSYIKNLTSIVSQSYKGHVTIVPSPTLNDYYTILENVTMDSYQEAF